MVELNHNVVSFNANTLVKGGHGVVVEVFVTKVGTGSNKVEFLNGVTSSATPIEFTIFTAAQGDYEHIHRRFENGIYAKCVGDAEITVVFK